MIIYGLKNCDTCRKAMRSFPSARLVDVRADGVPSDVMTRAFETFGAALVNTRSTTWRGLTEEERGQDKQQLLAAHPALMKRPLITVGNTIFLGWNKAIEDELNAMHEN